MLNYFCIKYYRYYMHRQYFQDVHKTVIIKNTQCYCLPRFWLWNGAARTTSTCPPHVPRKCTTTNHIMSMIAHFHFHREAQTILFRFHAAAGDKRTHHARKILRQSRSPTVKHAMNSFFVVGTSLSEGRWEPDFFNSGIEFRIDEDTVSPKTTNLYNFHCVVELHSGHLGFARLLKKLAARFTQQQFDKP